MEQVDPDGYRLGMNRGVSASEDGKPARHFRSLSQNDYAQAPIRTLPPSGRPLLVTYNTARTLWFSKL